MQIFPTGIPPKHEKTKQVVNILCYTLFMETKTEEVANWFGRAKFTFAQLKLGGASQA
jgi:hypothetical protein